MSSERISESVLQAIEERACADDSLVHRDSLNLVMALRGAYREIDDPNYQYAGRIPRGAILSRDAQIDRLRARVKELEAKVESSVPFDQCPNR